jgi:hypothetical protein
MKDKVRSLHCKQSLVTPQNVPLYIYLVGVCGASKPHLDESAENGSPFAATIPLGLNFLELHLL